MLQPDKDEASRMLQEELNDARYERESSGALRQAVERFLNWLDTQSFSIGSFEISYGPIILLLLLLAAIVLCIVLVRPRLQSPRGVDAPLETDPEVSADELRDRAAASAAAGDWGRAYRERFRALVRAAEERDILPARPGQTATEAAAEIAGTFTAEQAGLAAAAETFNSSVYGGQAPHPEVYRQLKDLDDRLSAAQPHPAAQHAGYSGGPRVVAPQ